MVEPRVMITNGGPHPAIKWAELSASEIIQVAEDSDSDAARAGRRLELKVIDILETYHEHVMAAEREQLDADGDGRLESPIDGLEHDPEEVLTQIAAAAQGTPFEAHFTSDVVQEHIRKVLAHHATNIVAIERSWYKDAHTEDGAPATEGKVN